VGLREGKTSDEDETRERKKNQEKGSYKFYVWETKYQAKKTEQGQNTVAGNDDTDINTMSKIY
jgi:hypothetical protein